MAADKSKTAPKPNMNTWADRVKVTDSCTRFTLDPVPRNDDGRTPEITADMLTENAEQWDRCMVGFFPGFRMNYHTVNTVANRIWNSGGLESVMSTASGFWLFRFQKEDQMQAILERGPWMVFGHACTGGTVTGENEASRTTDQVHGTVTANQIVVRKESNEGKHTLRKESTPKSLPSQNQTHGNQQPRGNHTLKVLMKDNTETTKGGKGERTTETTQEGKGERTTD
uniref:DUF4283 domain-containing protein n=1 Tax=Salix viminalis TaxID=40686 RepID=A0A6N2N5R3_SALVM